MADINDPRPVLRQELARVFKNQRVIRAFEKIFDLIPPEFIDQQQQIDDLSALITELSVEFSQVQEVSSLREQVESLTQQLKGLQQGSFI